MTDLSQVADKSVNGNTMVRHKHTGRPMLKHEFEFEEGRLGMTLEAN